MKDIENQMIEEKNNCYPEPVIFDEHYSTLMIALDHQVNKKNLQVIRCWGQG